ncbi:MAG TPA: Lrp/AsnC family transcriptional regulator [Longimicrobiales bacterium]|nr:Lrp/AsnC family transcriptional regulator [Longimicrobiales bacterium]
MSSVDATDRAIARALQSNARMTNAEIGRIVGLAQSSAHDRVRRLEAAGHIEGYHARLAARSFGLGVSAFVFVDAGDIAAEARVAEGLKAIPGVEEIHHIAGEDCFLVKLWAPDNEALGRLLRQDFGTAGARSTRTTIVLETLLDRPGPPLPGDGVANGGGGIR